MEAEVARELVQRLIKADGAKRRGVGSDELIKPAEELVAELKDMAHPSHFERRSRSSAQNRMMNVNCRLLQIGWRDGDLHDLVALVERLAAKPPSLTLRISRLQRKLRRADDMAPASRRRSRTMTAIRRGHRTTKQSSERKLANR